MRQDRTGRARGAHAAIALLFFTSALHAADPVEFSVGSFAFRRPDAWQWVVPSSAMRKAQLSIPGDGGPAEVTFFNFGPGQGGSIDANVKRWASQFQPEAGGPAALKREETLGSVRVTFVKAEGTFNGGMPGGPTVPKEGYALLGAILVDSAGDVYVKMTGPKSIVEASAPDFEAMIKAACEKKAETAAEWRSIGVNETGI